MLRDKGLLFTGIDIIGDYMTELNVTSPTGIRELQRETGLPIVEKLFDAPGDYSHEYFPMIANTGDVLVYGASSEGHEHDTADYEIFLWAIGAPAKQAVRLTHHTGNDCWPDLYLR